VTLGALYLGTAASSFDPRGPQAGAIADLFTSALVVCGAVFLLVAVLVGYCAVRFRANGVRAASTREGHVPLEIAWTIAPVLVLAWLLVLTVRAMSVADPPVDRPPDITVVGHQWWWEVKYPSGLVTANEIHVPTGRALVVRIESADVVHDFWVPELGRKIDAIPGRSATIWLEADRPGDYAGACAEYCGVEHAWMRIRVVAEAPERFEAWQRHQLAPSDPPASEASARGAKTFRTMTCVKCHAVAGADTASAELARFAPDLTHLASRATLGAGVLANTPANLQAWLRDPQRIKPGCHMPNAELTDGQAADLVAYFETLQ
jgi:cytochrome c oxidase subunit 2